MKSSKFQNTGKTGKTSSGKQTHPYSQVDKRKSQVTKLCFVVTRVKMSYSIFISKLGKIRKVIFFNNIFNSIFFSLLRIQETVQYRNNQWKGKLQHSWNGNKFGNSKFEEGASYYLEFEEFARA